MTKIKAKVPIIGFSAYSGTGKTTLLLKIIPLLKKRGFEVGVIKHAHHTFEIDQPGKDSFEIRKAGASQMLISSKTRWALMVEQEKEKQEKRLEEYIAQLDQDKLDIILVEGFKSEAIPKIELHRPSLNHPLIYEDDDSVIAVATDAPLNNKTTLPILDLNNHKAITDFIIEIINKK
ncbi:MAG TPA: molybdopterin-guanine dinucleotide biosynthesis protein B [Thiotrichaceae bacterium]|jgi:molybdopterin-guanine dinucleotide biosynthesis protein B|nr:molybdopterin-guanine dinucleotide biosynthesis protein B [Thiotrichaceae bacterium]HIM06979.1 molybdopterin-guanine dinucleotide biosynthesis protein B [Gammaproteobacteria bacterium]